MKTRIALMSLFAIMSLAMMANAQHTRLIFGTDHGIWAAGTQSSFSTTIKFTGLPNTNVRLREAIVSARSEAECFESTDFSNARPIGSDRASVSYDDSAGMYKVVWINQSETRESCRVLIGSGDVDGRDFLIWQRGASPTPALTEEDLSKPSGTLEARQSEPKFVYVYQVVMNP